MLNTAEDPIQFLKNEAVDAAEIVIISIHAPETMFTGPTEWFIVHRARRAWRFAVSALQLADPSFVPEPVGDVVVAAARHRSSKGN